MLQVSAGVRFGAGPPELARLRAFGGFRVARRIGDRHRRRAGSAAHRISGGGLAVEGQVQELAERLARILRRGEALPLTAAQEQGLSVGRKGDNRPELPAFAAGRIVPQQLHSLEPRTRAVADQLGSRQRQPAAAVRRRLRVAEVHQAVARERRRKLHVEQSALIRHHHPRCTGNRLLSPAGQIHKPDAARFLGDDGEARARQEVHCPRRIKGRHRGGGERRIGGYCSGIRAARLGGGVRGRAARGEYEAKAISCGTHLHVGCSVLVG